jgi:hypothetical protein
MQTMPRSFRRGACGAALLACLSGLAASAGVQSSSESGWEIPEDSDGFRICLERSPSCFGGEPDYRLTIDEHGRVTYEGLTNVRIEGTQESQLDPESLRSLRDAFVAAGFFSLRPDVEALKSFGPPHDSLTLSIGRRTHTVWWVPGSKAADYREMEALADLVDQMTESVQWVGEPPQPSNATVWMVLACGAGMAFLFGFLLFAVMRGYEL